MAFVAHDVTVLLGVSYLVSAILLAVLQETLP